MRRWQKVAVAGTGVLALGAVAAGGVLAEDPDAGDLPGTAMPVGAVTTVDGSLSDSTDADVYRVCIGEDGLTASTVGGTSIDTVLYVFDGDGRALAMNDDASPTWQSEVTLAGVAPGAYLVAVSAFGFIPVSTEGADMFTARAEAASPDAVLGGWRESHPDTGAYQLALTGAVECEASTEGPLVAPLDVLPGSADPSISSRSRGRTPMALLSVDGVDVSGLAGATIEIGPAGATPVKVQIADIDDDGVGDLLLHVRTTDLDLAPGTLDLCATVTPEQGAPVQGCETIAVR